MHEDRMGFNAVDELKLRIDEAMEIGEGVAVEAWEEFKSILEEEYANIESLEPAD